MRSLNLELAEELDKAAKAAAFLYIDSLDPATDRLPVQRCIVEATRDLLEINDRQIKSLKECCAGLSEVVRQMIQISGAAGHPLAPGAITMLTKLQGVLHVD